MPSKVSDKLQVLDVTVFNRPKAGSQNLAEDFSLQLKH